jgi:hypothetical protein
MFRKNAKELFMQWLGERCEQNAEFEDSVHELYVDYTTWMQDRDEPEELIQTFGIWMKRLKFERIFEPRHFKEGNKLRKRNLHYIGVRRIKS